MNRINLLLIIFIVTAFSGKNYAATKKESIAVFDFKLTNISPDTGNIVRNRIEYTLFKTRKFMKRHYHLLLRGLDFFAPSEPVFFNINLKKNIP